MLLPMLGFFLALVVLGGLGALVANDPHAPRWIVPLSYTALFSGLGAFGSLFLLYLLADSACGLVLGALAVLLLPVGIFTGAAVGCYLGVKRMRGSAGKLRLR